MAISLFSALRPTPRVPGPRRRVAQPLAIGAMLTAFALTALTAIAPPPSASSNDIWMTYLDQHAQTLTVSDTAAVTAITRDGYGATPGVETLVAGGTNHDWAKLVLLFAGLPMTEGNVTVFTRWMRQENGPDDWFNRNNPLNNGWGSGGGGGLGSYDNLVIAAENAAEAFYANAGYAGFVDAFARSAPTAEIESAIWASNWASGHYANGGHWSYAPVPVIKADPSAWGQ